MIMLRSFIALGHVLLYYSKKLGRIGSEDYEPKHQICRKDNFCFSFY